ncbi:MAG TPA: hypothetical protein VNJ01_01175 [Bacteriovoracaceae bacterium]|nr:hypothetical protein [Bacteriovoracaceae bacterium]
MKLKLIHGVGTFLFLLGQTVAYGREVKALCVDPRSNPVATLHASMPKDFFQNCYDNRVADPHDHDHDSEEVGKEEEKRILLSEKSTCDCLEKNNWTGFLPQDTNKAPSPEAAAKSNVAINVGAVNGNLNEAYNELAYYSLLISDDREQALANVKVYTPSTQENAAEISKANVKFKGSSLGMVKQVLDVPKLNNPLLEGQELVGEQCFTLGSYLLFKQAPARNEFLLDLAKAPFKEQDWNINNLRNDYEDLARRKPNAKAELKLIANRIQYLTFNPMIRYLFSADKGDEFKKEMYALMKAHLIPAPGCAAGKQGECSRGLITDGKYDAFRKKAAVLYTRPEVAVLIKSSYKKTQGEEINNIRLSALRAQPRITNIHQLEDFFQSISGGLSTQKCYGQQALGDKQNCREIFVNYCSQVKLSVVDDGKSIDLTPLEELELKLQREASVSPSKNDGYRKLTKKVCSDTRSNAAGKETTFKDWKKIYCTTDSAKVTCSNPDKLAAQFLSEYPGPEKEYDKFGTFLAKHNNVALTRDEVKNAEKEAVTSNKTAQKSKEVFKDFKFDEKGNTIATPGSEVKRLTETSAAKVTPVAAVAKSETSPSVPVTNPSLARANYSIRPADLAAQSATSPVLDSAESSLEKRLAELQTKLTATQAEVDTLRSNRNNPVKDETSDLASSEVSEETSGSTDEAEVGLQETREKLMDEIRALKADLEQTKLAREESSENTNGNVQSSSSSGITQNSFTGTRSPSSTVTSAAALMPSGPVRKLYQSELKSGSAVEVSENGRMISFSANESPGLTQMIMANAGKPQEKIFIQDDSSFKNLKSIVLSDEKVIDIATLTKLIDLGKVEFNKISLAKGGSIRVFNAKGDDSFVMQVTVDRDSNEKEFMAVKPDRTAKLTDLNHLIKSVR